MSDNVSHPANIENETEAQLLEAALATAKYDARASVPHEVVRAEMVVDIERLKRKIAQ